MPDPGWRILEFAAQDVVEPEDVIAMWLREGALDEPTARERVVEVLLVAVDGPAELVGVATAYLKRSEQLRMDLWHFRVYVAASHRRSEVAISLAREARDRLRERWTTGRDRRGAGVLYEVESAVLKQTFPQADWFYVDFVFIGSNEFDDHVRVHYFPGALAPPPPNA